jgi:hypothetical protein
VCELVGYPVNQAMAAPICIAVFTAGRLTTVLEGMIDIIVAGDIGTPH